MMEWFLVVASVTISSNMQGRYIGPLTEQSCRAAEQALQTNPLAIDARCKRAIGSTTCSLGQNPAIAVICPIFEGEMVTVGPR